MLMSSSANPSKKFLSMMLATKICCFEVLIDKNLNDKTFLHNPTNLLYCMLYTCMYICRCVHTCMQIR